MFDTLRFRAQAAAYRDLGKQTITPGEALGFKKLETRFATLADNEQWLADNHDKIVRATVRPEGAILAAEEEHVLRCLGAALIMQWNTLPRKLQRELFDTASSMGDLLETEDLRGQVGRFLHKHKDRP